MIKPGEDWGAPIAGPADFEVSGSDADLAGWAAEHLGARIRFRPTTPSDIARAVGLEDWREPSVELPMDLLRWGDTAVANMVVLGTPPDRLRRWTRTTEFTVNVDDGPWFAGRATTVVIATGEFLRGHDVVPRGHPGDGRAEIQVYAMAPSERALLRDRLGGGNHVPHPGIRQRLGRRIEVQARRNVRVEADGDRGTTKAVSLEVVPAAYRLLV